ncbi:hypothetical protein GCM10027052_00630 [Parafrigoribacterium mesophilum]|uniref:hypothetical protein n=1 Tax=Parafrigoribacterium mesophilum TaxID=433646 RepID=UPI0031FD650B
MARNTNVSTPNGDVMTDPDLPPSTPPPTVPPPTPPTTPPTNPPPGPGAPPEEPPLLDDVRGDYRGDHRDDHRGGAPGATAYGAGPAAAPYGTQTAYGTRDPAPKQTLSLTSFIVGLASLVFCWVPVLGFLGAIAAVIIGFIAKNREPQAPKWMWLVGIISGFAAILLSLLILIPLILLFAFGAAVSTGVPVPTP